MTYIRLNLNCWTKPDQLPAKYYKSKIRDWRRVYHEPIPDYLYSVNNHTGHCCDDDQSNRRKLLLCKMLISKHGCNKNCRNDNCSQIDLNCRNAAKAVFQNHINTGCQHNTDDTRFQATKNRLNIFVLQCGFSRAVTSRMMRKDGSTTARVAITAPRNPAWLLPT